MILTTGQGFRNGGKAPEFNSLTYHGLVRDGEWAVKIFSKQRISDEWLDKVFAGKVGWVFRKEVGLLLAFLCLYVNSNCVYSGNLIRNFLLQRRSLRSNLPKVSTMSTPSNRELPDCPLSGLETLIFCFRFISTMETETISSRNIVDLLLKEEFESSICKSQASDNATLSKSEEGFVYGWDC